MRPLNNIRRTLIRCLVGVCVFFSVACASMWEDPSFERMVSNANLIAVCEIMEDGTYAARAKVLDVVKGERPTGQILVGGNNNENWPEYAIQIESFKKGERYLFFLQEATEYVEEEFSRELEGWLEQELENGNLTAGEVPFERHQRGRKKYEKGYAVPTPSTGDYPVKTGTVYGGWHMTSHPGGDLGVPLPLATELIKGLVQHQAGQDPAAAKRRIVERLNVAAVEKTDSFEQEKPSKEATQHFAQLEWLLCAQAAYGDSDPKMAEVIQAAADHKFFALNILAGKALVSLDETPASLNIARTLISGTHSPAQSETAQSLMTGSFTAKGVGPIILAGLKDSKSSRRGPDNIMDPIRNVSSSGRETMVRAVSHFGLAAEAHDDLVKLLQPEGLNPGVFSALSAHFLKFPSDKARNRFIDLAKKAPEGSEELFIDYFLGEKSAASLRVVQEADIQQRHRTNGPNGWNGFTMRSESTTRFSTRPSPSWRPNGRSTSH